MSTATDNVLQNREHPIQTFKNKIINGGFDVWQRGISFTGLGNVYTADRWGRDNRDPSVDRIACDISGLGGYALQQSGGTQQRVITQGIELLNTGNAGEFQVGNTYTLSFWYKDDTSSNLETRIDFADGVVVATNLVLIDSKNHASSSTWAKYTHTFTIGSSPVASNTCVKIRFIGTGTTQTTALAYVQLEEGSVATPFEQRPYGLELALCQRYYEVQNSIAYLPQINTTSRHMTIRYMQTKRTTATVVIVSSTGAVVGSTYGNGFRVSEPTSYTNSLASRLESWTADAEL